MGEGVELLSSGAHVKLEEALVVIQSEITLNLVARVSVWSVNKTLVYTVGTARPLKVTL